MPWARASIGYGLDGCGNRRYRSSCPPQGVGSSATIARCQKSQLVPGICNVCGVIRICWCFLPQPTGRTLRLLSCPRRLVRPSSLPAAVELAKISDSMRRSAIVGASIGRSLNNAHAGSLREESRQRHSHRRCEESDRMVAVRLLMPNMIILPRPTPGSLGR